MTIIDFSITFKDEIGFPENAVFLTYLKRNWDEIWNNIIGIIKNFTKELHSETTAL